MLYNMNLLYKKKEHIILHEPQYNEISTYYIVWSHQVNYTVGAVFMNTAIANPTRHIAPCIAQYLVLVCAAWCSLDTAAEGYTALSTDGGQDKLTVLTIVISPEIRLRCKEYNDPVLWCSDRPGPLIQQSQWDSLPRMPIYPTCAGS